jgi:serine/threonine-protein kinase
VTLPDVAGQSVTSAEKTLHTDGLKTSVQSDADSNKPNTEVLRTKPAKGTVVQKGHTIVLVTGGAGRLIRVPDLVDQSVVSAKAALRHDDLQAKVSEAGFCTAQNVVCSQSPKGGSLRAPGKTVTLFTAPTTTTTTTAPTSPVPNVATFTTQAACNAIVKDGFICGTITMTSSSLTPGTVVSTDPAAGSLQPAGTTVNLVESSGPSTVVVPDVIGDMQAQAVSTLQGDNLLPVVNCLATSDPSQDGIVQSQSPQGGVTKPTGTSVTITVDSLQGCSTTTTAADRHHTHSGAGGKQAVLLGTGGVPPAGRPPEQIGPNRFSP